MPRPFFSLPDIQPCSHSNCQRLGVAKDGKCLAHSSIRDHIRSCYDSPAPTNLVRPIGVELEMLHPNGSQNFASIADYACSDGSLNSGGAELKVVDSATRIQDTAGLLALKAYHAGAIVDRSCGFHVHLSLPGGWSVCNSSGRRAAPSGVNISNVYRKMYEYAKVIEPYFFRIMNRRRVENSYCRRIGNNNYGTPESSMQNHYCWFSWSQKIPTIEIRLHGGTVNPWKVKGWLGVMRRLHKDIRAIAKGETVVAPTKFSDVCANNSLAKKYLLAREASPTLARFGPVVRRNG